MTQMEQSTPIFDKNASVAKLLLLAVMSVALCSFPPSFMLAPMPLAIAFLLYGRLVISVVAVSVTAILWTASVMAKGFPVYLAGMFVMAFLYAILVAEVIFRNINPVRGLIFTTLILVMVSGALLIGFNKASPTSLRGEISQSVSTLMMELKKQKKESPPGAVTGEEERAFDDFVNKPEALANEIYSSIPSIVFAVTFLGLWISLYVTLRNSIIWRYKVLYSYGLKDLTHFKVPDFFVYPVIVSLVLLLGVDFGLPAVSEIIGRNLLYCLGVLYAFQGLGVYNDFLKFIGMTGSRRRIGLYVLRFTFVGFTLFFAPRFLAIVGLFDLWIDFRKFFTNSKKNEGDTI